MPKLDFSAEEKRSLSLFPQLSFESYKDKSFMTGVEIYISDHFAFRTSLFSVKVRLDRLAGKDVINEVLFLDDKFVRPVTDLDEDNIVKNISAINYLASLTDVPVSVLIAPTSAGVYASDIPSYYKNVDQRTTIENINLGFDDKIRVLNPFSRLSSARDEYIYYRNDHHWTAYGAFVAYSYAIKLMGYTPVSFSNCDIERVSSDFYGTFYAQTLYNGFKADVIDNIHIKGGYTEQSVEIDTPDGTITSESMYFSSFLSSADEYSYYLNSALYPRVKIKTTYPEQNRILVIKDSYANCFVPFLTQHFSDITMIDLRSVSFMQINEMIDLSQYDRILVLYNFEDFVSDTNLQKLSLLK